MRLLFTLLLLATGLLSLPNYTVAQCPGVTAGFTYVTNDLQVIFSDTSSASAPLTYQWDFGDGHTDTTASPTSNYGLPGTYWVCLIVSDTCSSDTTCDSITVTCPAPTAAFSDSIADNMAWFTNQSTTPNNFPMSFVWDFGNGLASTDSSASSIYDSTGTYTVCLTASTPCGSDTVCSNINVTCDPPVAGFGINGGSLTLEFLNQTNTINSGVSYNWDFGDGDQSTAESPLHTFDTTGTYYVCLVATNLCGVDTFCDSVTVVCPTPTASFTNNFGNMNVDFTNTSFTGALFPQWEWDFGDGTSTSAQEPAHLYNLTGQYIVCLVVVDECGTDTFCQNISVCQEPVAEFVYSNVFENIQFTDLSTGPEISSYWWSFGDGAISTMSDPAYTYTSGGTYTVCLGIENPCGTDTTCTTLSILTSDVEPEAQYAELAKAYPNPASDYCLVQLSDPNATAIVEVIDLSGRLVTTAYNVYRGSVPLDLSKLATGYYQLRVHTEGQVQSLPLLIVR